MPQNTKKNTPGRKQNGQFKPGQSGNPGGRPKTDAALKERAREYTDLAIDALADIIETGKNESAKIRAAEAILNRGWGTPTQAVELTTPTAIKIEWPE